MIPLFFVTMALSMLAPNLGNGISRIIDPAYSILVFPLAFYALAGHFGIHLDSDDSPATPTASNTTNL